MGSQRRPVMSAAGLDTLVNRLVDLFALALAQVGLSVSRIIFVECGDEKTLLTRFEEGVRHGGGRVGERSHHEKQRYIALICEARLARISRSLGAGCSE